MPESIFKLQPNRVLELAYVSSPSADAALHSTSPNGWTLSGRWRQQHDYAIVQWNRDNRFDHPRLRYLPDGDFSGLRLEYDETRENCQPIESADFPFTDWPWLLVYASAAGASERLYRVPIRDHARVVAGALARASASFGIEGKGTAGDVISLSVMDKRWAYVVQSGDSPELIAQGIAAAVDSETAWVSASASGATVQLEALEPGIAGNRIGWQVTLSADATSTLAPGSGVLSGGTSTATWHVTLDFGGLIDQDGNAVPCSDIRLLRWVYSPAIQPPAGFAGPSQFAAVDFSVRVANWTLNGEGGALKVAGPLSQRIEDDDTRCVYSGSWAAQKGNLSGETQHYTTHAGDRVDVAYQHPFTHDLYLGTQRTFDSGIVSISIDDGAPFTVDLYSPGTFQNDIFLARMKLASNLAPGTHRLSITHTGAQNAQSTGTFLYVDFLDVAVASDVPDSPEVRTDVGLATDYDTAARSLSPERLAWSVDRLGLKGELNHFAGVEFWYEKEARGWANASASVTVGETVTPGDWVYLAVGGAAVSHAAAVGDTADSIASILAASLNSFTSVYAEAEGPVVTIQARVPGTAANGISITASTSADATETLGVSGNLAGGTDGTWLTTSDGALNAAAANWHRAFASACNAHSIPLRIALSLELKHAPADWGQKFADASTVITANGTVQTSPVVPGSVDFWKNAYRALATVMNSAGVTPRLQFGEVQWWYVAGGAPPSMAYYDAATQAAANAELGRPLCLFTSPADDPDANGGADANWLRDRLGAFCDVIRSTVLAAFPAANFEVLWPRDMNDPQFNPLNFRVNLPAANWCPANLAAFKTEAFQESWPQRNMNKAAVTVCFPFETLGFPRDATRHLLGVMADYPWDKQLQVAASERVGLVTMWAWDQFCAIGRAIPLPGPTRSAQYVG